MGKKGVSKYFGILKPGDKFGEWEILSDVFVDKESRVNARCSCGYESSPSVLTIIKGISTRCWKCGYSRKMEENPAWKGYKEIPYGWFSKYFERNTKRAGKRFGDITIEQVHELWISQDKKCALTGLPIDWIKREDGVSCSIDRISSDGEYTIDNIQLVHKDINLMKNHFDQDYFIQMCKLVCQNNLQ